MNRRTFLATLAAVPLASRLDAADEPATWDQTTWHGDDKCELRVFDCFGRPCDLPLEAALRAKLLFWGPTVEVQLGTTHARLEEAGWFIRSEWSTFVTRDRDRDFVVARLVFDRAEESPHGVFEYQLRPAFANYPKGARGYLPRITRYTEHEIEHWARVRFGVRKDP